MQKVNQPTTFAVGKSSIATTDVKSINGSMIHLSSSLMRASSEEEPQKLFLRTLKIPDISGLFCAKIRTVDPEIKDLVSRDFYFGLVLNSIFNILDNSLSDKGYAYHVDVKYRTCGDIKKAQIFVYLENSDFRDALLRWKEVSDEKVKLFKSLKENFEISQRIGDLDRLNRFIGIEFDSGD